jgi:TolB-like protein/tetratricopeptide (TPR) repeat protein
LQLLAELKRRNVFRMAGLYLVGSWLVVQVAETLLPIFGTPDWVLKVLVLLLALGFIPTLAFSWAFELTPDGLKRQHEVDRAQSITDQTARRLDIAVIVLLVGVAALSLWTSQRPAAETAIAPPTAPAETAAAATITDKSIAVLPFADFSQEGDQEWFADGLAEEILNALARTPDLRVSARTSSFKYKGSTLDVPQIAKELGVAHVLEGSVRSGGGRIRVTAQLIRSSDGFHLWSQTYDRDASDVIGIQEDLARQIAIAMQTSMDPEALADMARVGTASVEAYQAYLRGVAESLSTQPEGATRAYAYYEEARALDPTFAAAHVRAANYWLSMLDPTLTSSQKIPESPDQMSAKFRERIDLAIRHATRNVDRFASQALRAQHDLRLHDAIAFNRQVLAEHPTDREALGALLDLLTRTSQPEQMQAPLDTVWTLAFDRADWANLHLNYAHRGTDRRRAADQALEMAQRWPDDEGNLYQAHRALLWDGRVDEAREVFERWRRLAEQSNWSSVPPARQASAEGRCDEVERLLEALPADDLPQRWHLLMLLGRNEDARRLLESLERSGNLQGLAGFLSYRQFDPTPFPSLMAVLAREKIPRPPAETLPFACRPAPPAP